MTRMFIATHGHMFTTKARTLAIFGIAAMLWFSGLPAWIAPARAAALFDFSDTLTESGFNDLSAHRLTFTTTNALDQNDTIVITLDPVSSGFTIGNLGESDFVATTSLSVVTACGAGANEVTLATTSTTVTLSVCAGDTISAGVVSFQMGATTSPKITNPGTDGSRIIRVQTYADGAGLPVDSGDARVYIIQNVTVTAAVDSSFQFFINGVADGVTVNGAATSTATSTTATAIQFETLTPNSSKVVAQELQVITNSANGFSVTVHEDQNLTSSTQADIDLFIDGATTSSPVAWVSPTNVVGQENTFGHLGVTSDDGSLSWGGGDPFGTDLWAGAITAAQPLEVFYHNAPTDGTGAGVGTTTVGYQIEVDSLQEAGNDYTNTLTYVATPVF